MCFLGGFTHNKIQASPVGSLSSVVTGVYAALTCDSHVTLCDPMDSSLPGSSVHEISQARILEWVVISFSGGSL